MIIWITGMPCSGKTTIATMVEKAIDSKIVLIGNRGRKMCHVLDGDAVRSQFPKGVGFSREDREKHLALCGYMAKQIEKTTPFVICAFVSPFDDVRSQLPIDILVHADCSVETCMDRDVKGMWKKARDGEIKGFTGWDAPYEAPKKPDLHLNTESMTAEECASMVIRKMVDNEGDIK
jgi:adenylyl-sulfate kinase